MQNPEKYANDQKSVLVVACSVSVFTVALQHQYFTSRTDGLSCVGTTIPHSLPMLANFTDFETHANFKTAELRPINEFSGRTLLEIAPCRGSDPELNYIWTIINTFRQIGIKE